MANNLSGISYTNNFSNLDGLSIVQADEIYIDGIPINTDSFVPYQGATADINLGTFNFQTLGQVTAKKLALAAFDSTMMTSPTASSIFTADSWSMNNTVQISSLGGGLFLSTSYLTIKDVTNTSTLLTLQSDGIANFSTTKVRLSTMASNVYDVVNLSTLQASNAFIENVNSLNFVPYVGSLNNLDMGGSTIKTTGYVSTAYLTLSESTNGETWSLYTLSTLGNLSTLGGLVIQETTSGNSVYLTGGVVGAKNFQFSSPGSGNAGKIVCTNGYSVMSTTISAGQLEYINGLHSNAGGVGETNTWSNTQTFSVAPTLNGLTTTTPSFSLGVDGSNQVIKFTPPVVTNLLPLNNTWTGTNTFNNTVTVNGTLSATYIGGTTSYVATDDRTISPSEILANTARFYFGSYPNTGGTEYADAIGFNTYADGSGGNENLLMLRKNSIGMRVFQGAFGSTSPFTTYKDVVFSENNGDITMNGTLAVGNRFLGTVDGSNNFWMGLRGSGSEGDRLAIGIAGNATTGAVSGITLNKPTTCVGLSVPTGNIDVGTGVFNKVGTTAGYGATINGGDSSFSPFMEFFANGLRRLYLGYANTVDANIWAENGVNLNFGTNGALRMKITPAGNVEIGENITMGITKLLYLYNISGTNNAGITCEGSGDMVFFTGTAGTATRLRISAGGDTSTTGKLTVQDVVRFGNYSGGNYDNIQFMRGTGTGQYPNIRCQDNYIAMYVSDPNGWVAGSQIGDMVIKTETGNIRLGIAGTAGLVLNSSNNVSLSGSLTMAITQRIYLYNISGVNNAGIVCEGSGDMVFFTGTAGTGTRLRITAGGDVEAYKNLYANCLIVNGGGTYQAGCIYSDANWGMLFRAKVVPSSGIFGWYDANGTEMMKMWADGHMTHTSGDTSYMTYGPNATWSSYLVVGATPDRAGASTAQVISTNGNLHLDAGNSADMFYGYYANSRGTPNIHRWYGGDYQFSGVAQNYVNNAQVCVFVGDQMRKSQAMQRQLANYYGGWGGGYNINYAFYKQNTKVPVRIHGHYSGYWTGTYMGYAMIRIYNQTNTVYTYRILPTFTNNANNHITIPFDQVFTDAELTTTGWYEVYMYNYAGINTDANDVLTVNCTLLPVDYF